MEPSSSTPPTTSTAPGGGAARPPGASLPPPPPLGFGATPSLAPPGLGGTQSMLPTVIHLPPRRTLVPWLVAAAVVALAVIFRQALTLGFVAFCVAYVLAPVVRWAERFRIPRPITILVVMLAGTAVVVASASVLVPELLRQSESLVSSVPRYSAYVQREWIPWMREHWHLRIPSRTEDALAQLGLRASSIAPRIGAIVNNTLAYTIALLELLFKGLIVFALAFYFLLDFDALLHRAFDLVPYRARDRVGRLAREIDETLRHFINGQLLVMAILGVLFAVGLGLLGVPAWWGIGLFAGMISFVPYLGFFVALGLAMFMAALQGQGLAHVLAVLSVMGAVHILDLTVITPRILGGRAKISPVTVILSLIAGGTVFGFVGVLVAIPAASVLRVLLREVVSFYRSTTFYLATPQTTLRSIGPIAAVPTALQTDIPSVVLAPAAILAAPLPTGVAAAGPPGAEGGPRPSIAPPPPSPPEAAS